MHARGYQFVADLLDPDGTERQQIFATQSWQNVVSQPMEPPLALSAGQMIDFQCSYRNNEARTVVQGGMMMDEMCFFLGLYYPRDLKTELCSATDDSSGQSLGATWIGSGTADGAQTAACLQAAFVSPDPADRDACLVDACPAISAETSNAARCLTTGGPDPCAAAMTALAAAVCS